MLAGPGLMPPGTSVHHYGLKNRPVGRFQRFSSAPLRAMHALRIIDPDIIHFHDPELLPVAVMQAKLGKVVIWDAHEDYSHQFETGVGKPWVPSTLRVPAKSFADGLLRAIDKNAAAVVAATPVIASRYKNRRTVVVGNEARLDDFLACEPSFSARRVLSTGQTSDAHCFRQSVEAVAALDGVSLAVAGPEPVGGVWNWAQNVLGDRLIYLGWLDRKGMAEAISSSSVGLVTYQNSPTHDTNRPNKVFEFAAAGLPVVGTPNKSIRHLAGRGGFASIAKDFSADAFRDAIGEALSSEVNWIARSISARSWAQAEGSWTVSEAKLLALYSELLDELESSVG